MMIQQIAQRLREVNTFLATYTTHNQSEVSLNKPCRHLCSTVTSTRQTALSKKPDCCSVKMRSSFWNFFFPLSETDKYFSLDRTPLQKVDLQPFRRTPQTFEFRYEETKTVATELWRKYSAMSNRLDFLPLDSEEYKSLDAECSAAKAEYDEVHAHANLLYKEWQQERDRYFCVWCFKPVFLDVLVERLKGIAGSIISDIGRMKEGQP